MSKKYSRRAFVATTGAAFGAVLAGCAGKQAQAPTENTSDATQDATAAATGIDYLALVNKQHKLPDGWEDALQITHFKNSEDWDVDVETKAYEAYLALKDELEAADGVFVDLDSAYRSVEAQQKVVEEFTAQYGEEYVKLYVAVPGYSEHHTGLALDLFLIIDGKGVYKNEDMVTYPEIWEKIHARLADHGFILRYLPGKKIYTGYSYEPWHIRYLDDPVLAHKIADAGLTYEEYLDEVEPCVAGCKVDYGTSKLFKESDMDSALETILAEFRGWDGCVMQRFAYAGDEVCGAEELAWMNELREANTSDEPAFDQVISFVCDYHTPADAKGAWEPDTDYKDWGWYLGRKGADGSWKLMTWGYN